MSKRYTGCEVSQFSHDIFMGFRKGHKKCLRIKSTEVCMGLGYMGFRVYALGIWYGFRSASATKEICRKWSEAGDGFTIQNVQYASFLGSLTICLPCRPGVTGYLATHAIFVERLNPAHVFVVLFSVSGN